MSDKNASFDIIISREEESNCKNVLYEKRIILALFSFVLYEKRGKPFTIKIFFLQRETLFSTSLSYQLSTLFLKDLLGFLP